ncbi:MAG: Clp protease N-terminal domain-containing protein [Thermomicrobiales bacterium]
MHLPRRAVRRVGRTRPFARRCQTSPTFDRFTARAQAALSLAQDEARQLGHEYIGTEHVLLGILRRSDSVGARILDDLEVQLDVVRSAVEKTIGRGPMGVEGERRLTPRLKRVFDLSVKEAKSLGHGFVGTEHLLLGMLREGEGVGALILRDLGVTAERVRADVLRIVGK